MSKPDRDVPELQDVMRIAVPVEDEGKVTARRAHLVGILESEIRETPVRIRAEQRRARWRSGFKWVAVAAGALMTAGAGAALSGKAAPDEVAEKKARPQLASESKNTAPSAGFQSLTGHRFSTGPESGEVLRLLGETEVSVGPSTKGHIAHDTQRAQALRLTSGSISVSVPPERGGRTVDVVTPHATVSVKGTVFSVDVGRFDSFERPPVRTRVSVSRGTVVVHHGADQLTLEKGQVWLSPLPADAKGRSQPAKISASPRTVDARMTPASTLSAQNSLLERAIAAEARGDQAEAKRLIESFLTKYPRSALRSSALAVKKRLR